MISSTAHGLAPNVQDDSASFVYTMADVEVYVNESQSGHEKYFR